MLNQELLAETVEHAGGCDRVAMASQLAKRTHRERLVLFLLQFFEHLNPFDVLVVNVEDLVLV